MKLTLKITPILFAILYLFSTSCTIESNKEAELTFETFKFSDKVHLLGNENYPSCDIDISVLAPEDSINFKKLEAEMLKVYFDTLYKINANIDDLLFESAQFFIADFKEHEKYLLQDTIEIGASLSWQIILQNDIVYKDKKFISIMKELFAYTGGAHGNTNRFYYVYSFDKEKIVLASDIFKENSCNDLIELQKSSLNKIFEDTSGFWLDGLKCDQNFYVVESGLVFHYDQYEIASYAAGPIDIFLSFEEIEPFLREPELFEHLKKE